MTLFHPLRHTKMTKREQQIVILVVVVVLTTIRVVGHIHLLVQQLTLNHNRCHSHEIRDFRGKVIRWVKESVEKGVVEKGEGEKMGVRGGCIVPLHDKNINNNSKHDVAMKGDCNWWGWEKDGGREHRHKTPTITHPLSNPLASIIPSHDTPFHDTSSHNPPSLHTPSIHPLSHLLIHV